MEKHMCLTHTNANVTSKICNTEQLNNKEEASPNIYNIPSVIIKPKVKQDPKRTVTDIQEQVNPAKPGVAIKNMIATKIGNLIIKCNSVKDKEILKTEIDNKLKEKYTIEETKLKNPRKQYKKTK